MIRFVAALLILPFLLVLVLAAAMDLVGGELGSLTRETFELGPLSFVIFIGLELVAIFLPLLYAVSRFGGLSYLSAAVVGFLSALPQVQFGAWPVLSDPRLRWSFRLENLAGFYPWLVMGALGGLLFWLLAMYRNSSLSLFTGRS